MGTSKVLVKEGDVAYLTCPCCHRSKKLSVTKYRETSKRDLRIKCSCGNIFNLCLEFRKHPRKKTNILGKYLNLSRDKRNQDIMIKNISQGGIGFCSFSKVKTAVRDQLLVEFVLNNSCKTRIKTDMTVRTAGMDYVGCEFNSTQHFKTPLGFYLLD